MSVNLDCPKDLLQKVLKASMPSFNKQLVSQIGEIHQVQKALPSWPQYVKGIWINQPLSLSGHFKAGPEDLPPVPKAKFKAGSMLVQTKKVGDSSIHLFGEPVKIRQFKRTEALHLGGPVLEALKAPEQFWRVSEAALMKCLHLFVVSTFTVHTQLRLMSELGIRYPMVVPATQALQESSQLAATFLKENSLSNKTGKKGSYIGPLTIIAISFFLHHHSKAKLTSEEEKKTAELCCSLPTSKSKGKRKFDRPTIGGT
ncbi:hypothetical protein DFJ73DRAFT_770043 [Zopfochytrium polystomum]|nr:hypothetical protein DFJ73DRAFT_770043 [Zopfochytrium polystomum]